MDGHDSGDGQAGLVDLAVVEDLVDPDAGLLGANVVGIGQVFYDSQIYQACLAVPGVVAVHSLSVMLSSSTNAGPQYDPGAGGYLSLAKAGLTLTPEVAT